MAEASQRFLPGVPGTGNGVVLTQAAGEVALPLSASALDVAWQTALEELLRLVSLGGALVEAGERGLADTAPPPPATETAGTPPTDPLSAPQAAALPPEPDAGPDAGPGAGPLPSDYEIQPLGDPDGSPLALRDNDLFGGGQTIDLLPLAEPLAAQGNAGLGFDLFGNDSPLADGGPPLQVAGRGDPGLGVPRPGGGDGPAPKEPGDALPTPQAPGHLSLAGGAFDISLDQVTALSLADGQGHLLIEGDGDDLVELAGGIWTEIQMRDSEPGTQHFLDEQQLILVTVTGAEVEIPGAVVA